MLPWTQNVMVMKLSRGQEWGTTRRLVHSSSQTAQWWIVLVIPVWPSGHNNIHMTLLSERDGPSNLLFCVLFSASLLDCICFVCHRRLLPQPRVAVNRHACRPRLTCWPYTWCLVVSGVSCLGDIIRCHLLLHCPLCADNERPVLAAPAWHALCKWWKRAAASLWKHGPGLAVHAAPPKHDRKAPFLPWQ